jgi:hypothetical protein
MRSMEDEVRLLGAPEIPGVADFVEPRGSAGHSASVVPGGTASW